MKILYLVGGLFMGGAASFYWTKSLYQVDSVTSSARPQQAASNHLPSKANWQWSDSLDVLHAAAASHRLVYEDSTVRILQIVLQPATTEPVHTHQWRSVMWFTQATPMTYYKYGLSNQKLVLQDSIQIAQMPAEVLQHGAVVGAEEPHAIKNASKQTGLAYRVEFKQEVNP